MKSKVKLQQVKKGILLSVFAQIISLCVSFVMNLILPKFIDEYQYAYWQTYMLYIAYVGILHFGLLDGIVLRYSQYDYDELDKARLSSQFKILLFITSLSAFVTFVIALYIKSHVSSIILILLAVGMIIKNMFTYTTYTFQITNRINRYAQLVIAQRVLQGLGVLILLFCGVKAFYWFCFFDLLSELVACIWGAFYNKGLYFEKGLSLKETLLEARTNIASGIMLLIANWSSVFLIGSAKMFVQWHWDELVFGKVSFAFSVSNLFLSFVTAISVVLFPTLKRMDKDRLPELYRSIRNTVSPILFYSMICYFPGCWILEKWLPTYQPSLVYLGILLPIIIYSSKVSLLTNNYLKAYRKEKAMLFVNVVTVVCAFVLFAISAYVFNSLTLLLICIVLMIMIRSIISEIVVMKVIHIKFISDFIIEAVMTVLFIVCAQANSLFVGGLFYLLFLVVYSILYRKMLKNMVSQIVQKLKKGVKV